MLNRILPTDAPRTYSSKVLLLEKTVANVVLPPLRMVTDGKISKSMLGIFERIRAMATIGQLLQWLRKDLTQSELSVPAEAQIPTVEKIPFQTLLSLPLPFSAAARTELLTCQAPHMTTPPFSEDGEWVGTYFRFDSSAQLIHFSHKRLRFHATRRPEDPNRFRLDGLGVENDSGFALRGIFDAERCQYQAAKTDEPIPESWWNFFLLPWGFVGTQANTGGNWCWLWKAVWGEK